MEEFSNITGGLIADQSKKSIGMFEAATREFSGGRFQWYSMKARIREMVQLCIRDIVFLGVWRDYDQGDAEAKSAGRQVVVVGPGRSSRRPRRS